MSVVVVFVVMSIEDLLNNLSVEERSQLLVSLGVLTMILRVFEYSLSYRFSLLCNLFRQHALIPFNVQKLEDICNGEHNVLLVMRRKFLLSLSVLKERSFKTTKKVLKCLSMSDWHQIK
jgi:hypothetical protein